MKFVLIFMMSVLVVVTHQYFPGQQIREMPWLSPYLPQPYMGKYQHPFLDRYYSAPIRPIYSSLELPWENSPRNAHFAYVENLDSGENMEMIPDNFADVQSRGKVSLLPEQLSARFFFGTSATITNPFLKTATFTVSSTVTVTTGVNCIVAGDFVAAANQKIPCRRKRGLLESLGKPEEEDFIVPSEPLTMTATELPSLRRSSDSAGLGEITPSALDSSKSDDISRSTPSGVNLKEKRFIFFTNRNAFVVSTTVTKLSFVSKTATVTVDMANAAALLCLPTGYVVC